MNDTFAPLDRQLAALLQRHGQPAEVAHAAALVSQAVGEGHVCVHLPPLAGQDGLPGWSRWQSLLRQSPWVGAPGSARPLVLDAAGRLYLARYWHYEQQVALQLRQRAAAPGLAGAADALRLILDRLFPQPASPDAPVDWQKVACANALSSRCAVISGGPGTGKTTTVFRLLAAALQLSPQPLRVALAAPTGKAAARLAESMRQQRDHLALPAERLAALPEQAMTLHRLLGVQPDSVYFRHHAGRPLPYDVVVVDEASMIGMALMAKLLDAVPPSASLVLLGDHQQLASVESGAVFGDLCGRLGYGPERRHWLQQAVGAPLPESAAADSDFSNAVAILQVSHRFDDGRGIGRLARLVNAGDGPAAVALLSGTGQRELGGCLEAYAPARLTERLAQGYAAYWAAVAAVRRQPAALVDLFAAFAGFRVLAVLREGSTGVAGLNERLEAHWREHGQIPSAHGWYAGRPIMISGNDYGLRLYNGDIGLTLPTPDGMRVFFVGEDGLRSFAPARLPAHQTAWALTVHKSQGSEFDEVVLVLPETATPVLSRALVYTAITRARQRVEIWGSSSVLIDTLAEQRPRLSGLFERLA